MSSDNKNAVSAKDEVIIGEGQEDIIWEMMADKNGNGIYKMVLPLSHDVEFSQVNGAGENISVSSVILKGTETIINTPGAPVKWKLRIMNRGKDNSSVDPTGKPVTIDPDGSNDWFFSRVKGLDEKSQQVIQASFKDAKRTIIFQQEIAQ